MQRAMKKVGKSYGNFLPIVKSLQLVSNITRKGRKKEK